jgi:hypothetical protein
MRRLLLPLVGAAAAAVVLGLVLGHDGPSRPSAPPWPYPPHLVPRPDGSGTPAPAPADAPSTGRVQLLPPATGSARIYPL